MIAFINSKRAKVRHIVYNATQISLVVSKFKIFGLLSLLERVLHRHGVLLLTFIISWFQV